MRASLSGSVWRTIVRIGFVLSICAATFFNLIDLPTANAACTVNGVAYVDYNNNITRDQVEPGTGGVRVRAYQDTDGDTVEELISTTTTEISTDPAVHGTYSLPITTPDGQVRLEFTEFPDHLEPGRYGAGTFGAGTEGDTSVVFFDCGAGATNTIDFPLFSVGAYCHTANPNIGTSCYVSGDNLSTDPAIQAYSTFIGFPYTANGDAVPNVNEFSMAGPDDIGTTWGLGYQASSDSYYVASFVRRHTGLGPGLVDRTTTGGIYRITGVSDPTTSSVSLFMDLNAAPYNFNTGADPHPDPTNRPAWCDVAVPYDQCWQVDRDTFNTVSKIGLGDIEVSEDELRLYVVSLNRPAGRPYSEILSLPIGLDGVAPTAAQIGRIPLRLTDLPGASTTCPNYADLWPFALATHNERLYVGLVCSAESTQDRADLHAYVYSMDQFNPGLGFRQELTFPLDYTRRWANNNIAFGVTYTAEWQPWRTDVPAAYPATNFLRRNALVYPEPWLTGIVFDGEDMILTLRDRMGDRAGNVRNRPEETPVVDPPRIFQIGAGDILRVCYNPVTQGYGLENGGNCLGRPTRAVSINPGQGPGDDEFYHADQNDPPNGNDPTLVAHDEVTIGGAVALPSSGTVAVTAYDPLWPNYFAGDNGLFDAGIIWFDNTDGSRAQSFRLVNGGQGGPGNNQGKSNGLGDMELVCGSAPLEIGNRVWFDNNRNGIQDGDLALEFPVPGVILSLYMDTDSNGVVDLLVGRTTTNADGGYYFNETNIYWEAANPQYTGLLGAAIPNVNFYDLNGNGTREPIEAIGLMPNTVYEVRIDDPANYQAGGPLESTPGNEWFITRRFSAVLNDGNDLIRDSDGLPTTPLGPAPAPNVPQVTGAGSFTQVAGINNYPVRQLTTGSFGQNNHTYDFGFVRQPVLPTPTPGGSGGDGGEGASVSINKTVDPPFAAPGATVTWTITVTNNSSTVSASNVTVSDTIPSELTILPPVTASDGSVTVSGQQVNFSIAAMGPGQQIQIRITTRVSSSVAVPFTITNAAALRADGQSEQNASAKLVSAQMLPATGEAFLAQFRLPLIVMGISLGLMAVLWYMGRSRRGSV